MAGHRISHSEAWWAKQPPHVVRCTARYKSGEPCRREAVPGASVCGQHGGQIPQVQRAAAVRIQYAVEDAAKRLVEWMNDPNVDIRERLKAAESLLDRGGLGAAQKVIVGVSNDDPVEQLFQRLLSEPGALEEPAPPVLELEASEPEDVVDAEVVEDGEEPEELAPVTRLRSPERPPIPSPPTPPHIRRALEMLL